MSVEAKQRRAHIVMSAELIAEIDAQVGPRRRSRFIEDAVAEKLRRQRRVEAFDGVVGSLKDVDIPGWESPEAAAQWVHDLRRHPEKLAEQLAHRDS
jgi:hypothetical protein